MTAVVPVVALVPELAVALVLESVLAPALVLVPVVTPELATVPVLILAQFPVQSQALMLILLWKAEGFHYFRFVSW